MSALGFGTQPYSWVVEVPYQTFLGSNLDQLIKFIVVIKSETKAEINDRLLFSFL